MQTKNGGYAHECSVGSDAGSGSRSGSAKTKLAGRRWRFCFHCFCARRPAVQHVLQYSRFVLSSPPELRQEFLDPCPSPCIYLSTSHTVVPLERLVCLPWWQPFSRFPTLRPTSRLVAESERMLLPPWQAYRTAPAGRPAGQQAIQLGGHVRGAHLNAVQSVLVVRCSHPLFVLVGASTKLGFFLTLFPFPSPLFPVPSLDRRFPLHLQQALSYSVNVFLWCLLAFELIKGGHMFALFMDETRKMSLLSIQTHLKIVCKLWQTIAFINCTRRRCSNWKGFDCIIRRAITWSNT